MSHPGYPNAIPVAAVIERLSAAASDATHMFWADDLSILDSSVVDSSRIHGPRQLTDIYLLALSIAREAGS